ncbi:MAG: hypothetical protein IKP91_03135 [Bacteroidaceae bacterium]|nr:hypothetical protein [Bacteroidaceae bacterium]
MEELQIKAEKYAAEKTQEVIAKAIAQAYFDGYSDGYKDGEEHTAIDFRVSNPHFIDLGLPSGTMWASDFERDKEDIRHLTYGQASHFALPTKEQVQELFDNCMWFRQGKGHYNACYVCIGPNGKSITFDNASYKIPYPEEEKHVFMYTLSSFWIESKNESLKKNSAWIKVEGENIDKELKETHPGMMLPIRLVSNKKI